MNARVHFGTVGDYVVEASTHDNEFYSVKVQQGSEFVTHRLFVGEGGISPASLIAIARHRLEHTTAGKTQDTAIGLLIQAEGLING